ncbi:hypothetical protein SeMB42_g03108 [Synchytrium endobioticum]|uniref:SWIRM domain-containing protein n=1 Tax=Synchytrium endobioticum TaxID=286115 RepID=A0A507DB87_9FUNG|nr:hypothetical protein SeMB42_g03108 [Synchytrium endobioticum]
MRPWWALPQSRADPRHKPRTHVLVLVLALALGPAPARVRVRVRVGSSQRPNATTSHSLRLKSRHKHAYHHAEFPSIQAVDANHMRQWLPSPPPTVKLGLRLRSASVPGPEVASLVFNDEPDKDNDEVFSHQTPYHHHMQRPDRKAGNRRKLSPPTRSLSKSLSLQEKLHHGVLVLDVYALYKSNPSTLLTPKRPRHRRHHPYRQSPHKRAAYNPQSASPPPMTNTGTTRATSSPDPVCSPSTSPPKRSSSSSASNAFSAVAANSTGTTMHRPVGRPKKRGKAAAHASSTSSNASPSKYHEGPKQLKTVPQGFDPFHPTSDAFDDVPPITWSKSLPMDIRPDTEGFELLVPQEITSCSTLRLTPMAYLKIKETLLIHDGRPLKKREAQSVCRVDVNKVGKLYDWFVTLGWLIPPQSSSIAN